MIKYINCLFITAVFLCLANHTCRAQDQSSALKIGYNIPDFKLNNVGHFYKSSVSSADFKGKWLILDFWSKTCSACIHGFPKLNNLQTEFKEQIQVLLIGNDEFKYNAGIEKMFERIRLRQQLNLPVAYDSLLFKKFEITAMPFVVIIDPDGVVRALTTSMELDKEMLATLINKDPKRMETKKETQQQNFYFKSEISIWNKNIPLIMNDKIDVGLAEGKYMTNAMTLGKLYNIAYHGETDWSFGTPLYGKTYSTPLLLLSDTTRFCNNYFKELGFYNYTLTVPIRKASKDYLMFAMQCDFQKYFRYHATIEYRKMPCWFLIKSDKLAEQYLKSKAKTKSKNSDHSGFQFSKVQIKEIIETVWNYHQTEYPFIDKTGISEDIDLSIDADLTNFNDVCTALKLKGLKFVKGKKLMKVLVIRD